MLQSIEIPCGDPAIFSSSDVIRPHAAPGGLDSPIQEDSRGKIIRIREGGCVNVLFTKKGCYRSGDVHSNTQFDVIITGSIELTTLENGKNVTRIIKPNTLLSIGKNTPHLFKFLEDTLLLEWWDSPFDGWYYLPYRKIIDAQSK